MIRALAGAVAAGGGAAAARRTRTLSESGRWAAFCLGVVSTAAGWWWALTLIVFFVAAVALTRWHLPEKLRITEGTLPRAAERNARQVFANGGLFVVLASLAAYSGREPLAIAALGALAAASSDSWSTEIGTAFGGTPRLITTWKTVEPGMSGGVTVAGLGAAVAGALLIGCCGTLVLPGRGARVALAVAVGGFGGGLTDSIVGAVLQSKRFCDRCERYTERRVHTCGYRTRHARGVRWMSNDAVNVCGTVAGAVIAAVAGILMHA